MHRTKHAACAAAALAALVLAAPGAARAGIDDGLVASYTFDDATARDVSGNGNDGTAMGPVQFAPGWKGTALKLAGVSSWPREYVTAAPTSSLALLDQRYTFALWFNIESFTSMNGWGQTTENGLHALFAKAGDRNGLDLRAQRSEGEALMRLWAFDGRCCGGGAAIWTDATVGVNEWHHAAVTSGGVDGFVRLYLDGVLAGELPATTFDLNPQMQYMPLQLGIDQDAWWYPLDGMLDEVRVYGRELSPAEIAVLANRDFAPPEITLTTPSEGQSFLLNGPVLAEWSATDAGAVASGVCSASGTVPSGDPLDTGTVGAHAFTVDAADCAGNLASASAQYWVQYAFGGFLPPLNSERSVVDRAGNNVSVKFQLADAAGALVTTATPWLEYAEVLDAANGTLGPGIVPADGGAFRYDEVSGQYVYNLSTRALTVGKTYELDVWLGDGTAHTALLEIR